MLPHKVDIVGEPPLPLLDCGLPAVAPALSSCLQLRRARDSRVGSSRLPALAEIRPEPKEQSNDDWRKCRVLSITAIAIQSLSPDLDLFLGQVDKAVGPTHSGRSFTGDADNGEVDLDKKEAQWSSVLHEKTKDKTDRKRL